jgi:hypothetical protein
MGLHLFLHSLLTFKVEREKEEDRVRGGEERRGEERKGRKREEKEMCSLSFTSINMTPISLRHLLPRRWERGEMRRDEKSKRKKKEEREERKFVVYPLHVSHAMTHGYDTSFSTPSTASIKSSVTAT